MIALVRIVRGIAGVVAVLQLFGLLPILSWLQDLSAVSGGMLAILVVKLIFLAIASAVFFSLRPLIHNMHARKHGVPHPALVSKWAF